MFMLCLYMSYIFMLCLYDLYDIYHIYYLPHIHCIKTEYIYPDFPDRQTYSDLGKYLFTDQH